VNLRSWPLALPAIYYDRTGIVEHLYDYQVAGILSLFFKLTNPGGQLFLTTPNYQRAWPLIELLLDRFGLVATLDAGLISFPFARELRTF
jgi:hypothetical protein